jgi:hypothetical protein
VVERIRGGKGAGKEDLGKILAEMRIVTAIQKQIEERLSGTEWRLL